MAPQSLTPDTRFSQLPPALARHLRQSVPITAAVPTGSAVVSSKPAISLSDEQQRLVDVVATGQDVVVDATVGAGKTTAIQALCAAQGDREVLYLTYSKLLKLDAQRRVTGAKVQNYHGIVYPHLRAAGISCGISEAIARFNESFVDLSVQVPRYDLLVIDEYQDITAEYAQLLRNLKSVNPLMQIVMVGDMAQKVKSNTRLDVMEFVTDFCEQPQLLPFTQSFRVGPQLGEMLAQAWNKPVVGVNTNQRVRTMDFDEALDYMGTRTPGDLLCLGKRNGSMVEALNELEERHPLVFNKNTVYASIRNGDTGVSYGDDAAVFTTYDSSKGLERPIAVVFDYDEKHWDVRLRFPDVDPSVLRNIFLVAASRGKQEVIFVSPRSGARGAGGAGMIGSIPITRFTHLPAVTRPQYVRPFQAASCFDFKYAENVEACFDLLDVERLDDGSGEVIEIERSEGLIDLSPVVGHYQEALYFDDYDAESATRGYSVKMTELLRHELTQDDPWRNALLLSAISTEQLRYADQVKAVIPQHVERALMDRLATQLPSDCEIQRGLELNGTALHSRTESSPVIFQGITDAIHDDQVFELKFVTELAHPMFLQVAMQLVLSGLESGVLWNTRTDERWQIKVPDRGRFMHAVVLCVSKQSYRMFEDSHAQLVA